MERNKLDVLNRRAEEMEVSEKKETAEAEEGTNGR